MILVRLMGGMGNQMFQYALGRTLAEKHKSILKLDLTLLLDRTPVPNAVFRNYDLDVFNIQEVFATKDEIEYFNPTSRNIFSRIKYRVRRKLKPKELFIQRFSGFDASVLQLPDNVCLAGSWQSEKYFSAISGIIKNEFTLKKKFDAKTQKIADKILSENAVCINIRRADYVTNPLYNHLLGTINIEYYSRAIEYIVQRMSNTHFFIFSDDLEWTVENLKFNLPVTFVTPEFYGEKYSFKFKLMTLCKHFIIPNSTFGWWGAWLSENKDKIVIAPKQWHKNEKVNSNDIVPEHWIRM